MKYLIGVSDTITLNFSFFSLVIIVNIVIIYENDPDTSEFGNPYPLCISTREILRKLCTATINLSRHQAEHLRRESS